MGILINVVRVKRFLFLFDDIKAEKVLSQLSAKLTKTML